MKRIIGLDLGVTSIGWALIEDDDEELKIIDIGSRIISLSADDKNEFSSGNKISKNQKRTLKRTIRRGYDRYQLRKKNLIAFLSENDMYDRELDKLSAIQLFELRSRAVTEKITLTELGRILYHLNQKRGYKSSRADANLDKKETEYVAEIKNRHQHLKEEGITIGQYFYKHLTANPWHRVKKAIFPREAYIEEFEAICREQRKYHPLLNDETIALLKDNIIYYQRKLKSKKGLVSVCEFEGTNMPDEKGRLVLRGPRVAPKSSPLFQVCKIWESINNITLKNRSGQIYELSAEDKYNLFTHLDNHKVLSQADMFKILKLKKDDGWYGNKHINKGIQGNVTKTAILEKLDNYPGAAALLRFDLQVAEMEGTARLVNRKTDEVTDEKIQYKITPDFEYEPLYKLWYTIYSLSDKEECSNALMKNFGLQEDRALALAGIDFSKYGFGNKSARAMRKILPYLREGYHYSDACSFAGYNHSDGLTREENSRRQLLTHLPIVEKNSIRQPVVEKILNQMINVVNALVDQYGTPDEIRVELARELKQSREERNDAFTSLTKRERENEILAARIEEFGLKATRKRIIKYRLFQEIDERDSKLNAVCIYCGNPFTLTGALGGDEVDVEHIIPKAKLFDDSQSNKTLSHRKCNDAKGNRTAFDYMRQKGDAEFDAYIERVEELYKQKLIGKGKRDKLLMSEDKIPQNFIDRQLRETQYISRKATEILQLICRDVSATSGGVTEYLRRIWGWDDVLLNLQLPAYRAMGLTEWKEAEDKAGLVRRYEVIKDWSKRDDHRHHAVDALVVACTKPGFIKRLNTLNAQHTRDEMYGEVQHGDGFREKLSLLDNYMISKKPFTTQQVQDAVSGVLVSFKAGKKVAVVSRYKAAGINKQKGVIIPKGPLNEESVYGVIKTIEKNKPVKYLFENPHLIFKPYIKQLVEDRLAEFENNSKKALASLKKLPIYLDEAHTVELTYASCFKQEYVMKYPIGSLKAKDTEFIVDAKVRALVRQRLAAFDNKEKEAFKDLDTNPIWLNEEKRIPILSVRCYTGLSAVEAVKKNEAGKPIGFVKPGNNHHVAFYIDANGEKVEHVCSFWHAVERKKYGIPAVITSPQTVWTKVLDNAALYPEDFLAKLPGDQWTYWESLQQNEMFIIGLSRDEVNAAIQSKQYRLLGQYLYRVQKITTKEYVFRAHTETQLNNSIESKTAKRFIIVQSIGTLNKINPVKVRVNNLGHISLS